VRKGVLPRLLNEILTTRVMVKQVRPGAPRYTTVKPSASWSSRYALGVPWAHQATPRASWSSRYALGVPQVHHAQAQCVGARWCATGVSGSSSVRHGQTPVCLLSVLSLLYELVWGKHHISPISLLCVLPWSLRP